MAAEKAPAFQFYPKDFLTDGHVMAMNLTELGAYIRLLCLCWMEQSLPSDLVVLGRRCGVSAVTFTRLWPALEPCFVVSEGRLVQPRIERERRKQDTWRAMKAEAGKKGGEAKAAAKQKRSRRLAEASPPSSSSSSLSDLPSSSSVFDLQPSVENTETRFRRFWAIYPNRKAKGEALKAWQKRNPSEAMTEIIIAAVERQKLWPDWTKNSGQFIPHPATWLNRGSWEDESTVAVVSRVSDIGRQNAANAEEALRIMEERDAAER
ncbi:MAG: DUF1376 domain-containing protein [Vicinamibacterales bacterium]